MAVCGEAQADAVAKVFKDDFNLPSARLTADTQAIWYLDKTAASKLPSECLWDSVHFGSILFCIYFILRFQIKIYDRM